MRGRYFTTKGDYLCLTTFELTDERGEPYVWTPCREEPAAEDPQSEGVAVDAARDVL